MDKLILFIVTLTILLVVDVCSAVVPSDQSRGFGQCGLAPYDITTETIKKNGLNTSDADQIEKFWQNHVPAAYRYQWSQYSRPVGLRQAMPKPIKEPVFIRLKVLYDDTLAAQHPNVETLRRYIRNILLDVQMVLWQPELFHLMKIKLIIVELAQLDERLGLDDTMARILWRIEKYNARPDKSIDYYDMVLLLVYRSLYDINPDSSIHQAIGVSNPYSFCNQKINPYASRGIVVEVSASTVSTTAHEIGHALGLMHDGIEPNVLSGTANCNPQEYIMAATSDIGQTRWSACSVRAMLLYLNAAEVFECVFNKNRTRDAKPLSPQFDWLEQEAYALKPGQEMPPEEQCILALGEPAHPKKEASYQNRGPYEYKYLESCQALFCELHSRSIFVGPAQHGSTCLTHPNNLKGMCINRMCMASNSKKEVNATTGQGV